MMKRQALGAVKMELIALVVMSCALLGALIWLNAPRGHESMISVPASVTPHADGTQPADPVSDRPMGSRWDGEITFFSDRVSGTIGGAETTVWVYLPGDKLKTASVPAVFIAADGTNGLIGAALDEKNQREHLPWVRAGFAVVAYSLAGAMGENANDEQTLAAARAFQAAHGGVEDTGLAVAYALSRFPEIDTKRLYLVGSGSAGTVALDVAGRDARFAGCAVFSPIIKVAEYSSRGIMTVLEEMVPGTKAFAEEVSPAAENIKCPVLVVHADDDAKVPVADVEQFVAMLQKESKGTMLARVPKGGEEDVDLQAMIGIGVKWMKELGEKK